MHVVRVIFETVERPKMNSEYAGDEFIHNSVSPLLLIEDSAQRFYP